MLNAPFLNPPLHSTLAFPFVQYRHWVSSSEDYAEHVLNLSGFNKLPELMPVAAHKTGNSTQTVLVDTD